MRVWIVGVGNLGAAIVRSLLASQHSADDITLIERNPNDRKDLEDQFQCRVFGEIPGGVRLGAGDVLLLAIKPQDAALACAPLAAILHPESLVLSVLAGVSIKKLSGWLDHAKIVRSMPNLGASISESATAYYPSLEVTPEDLARIERIISAMGKGWRVADESLIDVATAVAGSGPAYVCWLAEQVEQVAVELGISSNDAHAIVLQTFRGALLYLEHSQLSFSELRKRVTSPHGTTAAALSILSQSQADLVIQAAIKAALKRAQELGA
jgi:pyrroline-5-carboxylate reductase